MTIPILTMHEHLRTLFSVLHPHNLVWISLGNSLNFREVLMVVA